jgi:hypothetical protein
MKRPITLSTILYLFLISCHIIQAPIRGVSPTSSIPLNINLPETVARDQGLQFTIATLPGNICRAWVSYYNQQSRWVIEEFPESIADSNGTCAFEWPIPSDAATGKAELRVSVTDGRDATNSSPLHFCIDACLED